MIEVFLTVIACMEPDYERCQVLHEYEMSDWPPYVCQLNRPYMASVWQTQVYDGWLTFTECEAYWPKEAELEMQAPWMGPGRRDK